MKLSTLRLHLSVPALIAVFFSLLTSCDFFNKHSDEVEYIPVQLREDGGWVFIDSEGKRVGTQEWEFEPTVTKGGIFVAKGDSGLTVYKWKGEEAKPVDSLTNLVSAGVYADGLLPVTPQMNRIRIVDKDGDMKFELLPIDGKEISSCALQFNEGLLVVSTTEGKSGVVDSKGNTIVKPQFDDISEFNGGFALAVNYNYNEEKYQGPTYYIIDKEGNINKVKGKFGGSLDEEGECYQSLYPFDNAGYAYVSSFVDYEKNPEERRSVLRISTDGTVTQMKSKNYVVSFDALENGNSYIEIESTEDGLESVWKNMEGKTILKNTDWMNTVADYVFVPDSNSISVYNSEGKQILKKKDMSWGTCPGGNFGPVLTGYDYESSETKYELFNKEGQPIETGRIYGLGMSKAIVLDADDEIGCPVTSVTSAYVDITAAAKKISDMATHSISGKKMYWLGQSVTDILEGENASYYAYSDYSFNLPTGDKPHLADGEGFWVDGRAHTSAKIVAPIYQNYFEVHHVDWRGVKWGWNRTRQVGVHFNSSAKVDRFDVQLHTNHPSGKALREAVTRRMKKEGFTLVESQPNYDEYTNGYSNVIIYGNESSKGVGAYIRNDKSSKLSDTEKSALAATLY